MPENIIAVKNLEYKYGDFKAGRRQLLLIFQKAV